MKLNISDWLPELDYCHELLMFIFNLGNDTVMIAVIEGLQVEGQKESKGSSAVLASALDARQGRGQQVSHENSWKHAHLSPLVGQPDTAPTSSLVERLGLERDWSCWGGFQESAMTRTDAKCR